MSTVYLQYSMDTLLHIYYYFGDSYRVALLMEMGLLYDYFGNLSTQDETFCFIVGEGEVASTQVRLKQTLK